MISLFLINCTNVNSYESYKTIKTEHVKTIGSDVVQMVHEKSGATVILIKNKDQARSFMAGFRTPPYDDTGLFHIFEHAVLAGSRLYPSKSNFFNLANSSVASFINAMTGSVYTYYPFVTRSPKDFDNLMSSYLDAVFFPNTVKDPRLIAREGWRYEVNPQTKKMSINGIVLSEMKGAFSSPYRSLWFQTTRSLLPQTPFAFSSGGLPEQIATLSFDQIVDAHKKYYHPQNSVIYLYGDLDYKKQLAKIDKQFLSHFAKDPKYVRPEIKLQTDFNYPTPIVEATYPGEKAKNKDFIGKGFVLGKDLTVTEENAAAVLAQAFSENNAAPLKLRALKEGIAKSTFFMGAGGQDNGITFVFEGANASDKEKIEHILDDEISKVVSQGLDPELLNSILNKYEFSFKEKNSNGSHKGMQLGSIVLSNWIYQDEPLNEALDFVSQFKKLRALLNDQTFVKNFFKKHFKENTHSRWVILKPDPEFSKKFNAGLDKKVNEALKEKSFADYEKDFATYKKWVAEKEPQDILNKTPTLKLSDIKTDEPPIKSKKVSAGNTTILQYPQDTSGITYMELYFDLKGVSQENLRHLPLLPSFLKKTDTTNYPFKKLSKEIDTYIGGIGIGVSTYQSLKTPDNFKPSMTLSFRFINENKDKAIKLIQELVTESQFTPKNRLNNLLEEIKSNMASSVANRAPGLSRAAASKSFFPDLGAFNDETGGGTFENHMRSTKMTAESLIPKLQTLLKNIFNQKRLYLATLTTSENDLNKYTDEIKKLKASFPKEASSDQTWDFSKQKNYNAYAIPGEVQYVTQTTSYTKKNLEYDGSLLVYQTYLNSKYMTPRLREQAGAYGGWSSFSRTGLFTMATYKDPNLRRSLKIFSEAMEFMKKEKVTPEKLQPAILGSLKSYYKDKSIPAKTDFMTYLYLTDQTWADYLELKKEILETTPEEFSKITEKLSQSLKETKVGVAGNTKKLKTEASFLKNILSFL